MEIALGITIIAVIYLFIIVYKMEGSLMRLLKKDAEALNRLITATELAANMYARLEALEKKIKNIGKN